MGYFKFDKLDKIDKIVIVLTFIVVSFFSIFSCFCFATEDETKIIDGVEFGVVQGLAANTSDFVFYESSQHYVTYAKLKKGVSYKVTRVNSHYGQRFFVTNDIVSGGSFEIFTYLNNAGDSVTFVADDDYYFVSYNVNAPSDFLMQNIYNFEELTGFSSAVVSLVDNVSFNSLFEVFEISIPFILIVVLVVFGIYLIVRVVKGVSKGKGSL